MKKIGTTLALAAAAGMTFVPAQLAAQSDNAALVINQSTCGGVLTIDGITVGVSTDDGATAVETSSGNAMFVCNLDVFFASADITSAISLEGFGCGFGGNFTTDTRIVVTPGGKATAVCKFLD